MAEDCFNSYIFLFTFFLRHSAAKNKLVNNLNVPSLWQISENENLYFVNYFKG